MQHPWLWAVPVGSQSLNIASRGILLHTAQQKIVIFTGICAAAEFGRRHGGALWHGLLVLVVSGGKKKKKKQVNFKTAASVLCITMGEAMLWSAALPEMSLHILMKKSGK